jgi:hypothetical protein
MIMHMQKFEVTDWLQSGRPLRATMWKPAALQATASGKLVFVYEAENRCELQDSKPLITTERKTADNYRAEYR